VNLFRCSVCNRRRFPLLPHGSLRRERVVFPDGGWFRWSRFAPCSVLAPGGVPSGSLLDDDEGFDLDSVRGVDTWSEPEGVE